MARSTQRHVTSGQGRQPHLSLASKAAIVVRTWIAFLVVYVGVKRHPLPELLGRLGTTERGRFHSPRIDARRLGRIVGRVLRLPRYRPRCLYSALVLYRLLRRQGDAPQLVIGLPHRPLDKDAHAWVELDGVDVGPPPGRGPHEELARYG
jgi:hypothetical protein